MKLTRKLAAIVLAVMMLLTTVPMTAFFAAAADISSSELVWGNAQGITRAQWLHNLVVVFEMDALPESLPDNYFSDLTSSHPYYEDILMAVEHGVVDVGAGYAMQPDALVTRDFAAYTLNFCLGYQISEGAGYTFSDHAASVSPDSAQVALDRGWFALKNGAFCPQTAVTSAEVKTMLTDAAAVLEKEIIDPDYDSVFQFQSDVKVLPDGTSVSEDENGNVTVVNCPLTISAGDKFAAFFGGIPRGYKALTVTKSGTTTLITTQELSLQETFVSLDMQGVTDADAMEFTPIGDAQLELVEEPDPTSFFAVKTIPTVQIKTKLNLGDGLSVNIAAKVKNPRVEYDVTTKRAYVKLIGDTEITYEAKAELVNADGKDISVDLCKVGVPGVGGFTLSAVLEMSGGASGTVKGTLTAGIECTYGSGIRAVKSFSQKECYSRAEASASVGLKAKLGVTDLPIVNAYLYAEVGFKAQVYNNAYPTGTPRSCSQFAGFLYASYGAQASIEFFNWETTFQKEYEIFDDTNSPVRLVFHYEDGKQVATCTRGDHAGGAGTFGSGGANWRYFTNADSQWSGNGWTGADNSYGLTADGQPVRLFDYSLNSSNQATITKYYGDGWSVSIPETIDGYTVIGIDSGVFKAKILAHITFPEGLKTIGSKAFEGCTNLGEVVFPSSFEVLGCGAFIQCRGLRRVYITKNMRAADYCGANYQYPGPFTDCENLRTVEFESGITEIPDALFISCPGIEHVEIPKTVTLIKPNAFAECINLQSVTFHESLQEIGAGAFRDDESLTTFTLPQSLQVLGCGAFKNCVSLEAVNIPRDVFTGANCGANYQYPGPFAGCEKLNTVTFAPGITRIPTALFANCTGLTSITIPATVTRLHVHAFANCTNLQSISLPQALTDIESYAFAGCTALKRVTLPADLKVLGCGAFQHSTALQSINIPKDMNTGDYCGNRGYDGPFNGCSSLTDVRFDAGFSVMPNALFWNCTGLQSLTLPNTATNISWKAFAGCSNLKTVVIPGSVRTISSDAFLESGLQEITIPTSVTTIDARAFQKTKLTSICFPDSVTAIGDHVVADCPNLKTVVWSAGATTIQDYSFAGSTAIESITLPNTVKYLRKGVFRDCDALKSVTLPDSIETIGNELFYGCDSLQQAAIPNSVTSIGSNAFYNCKNLTSVSLSNKLTAIPGATFEGCAALTEAVVPAMVTKIDNAAFANCPLLAKVYLPRTLTSVSTSAFSYKQINVLYGVPGTYAQTWASDNGYSFISHTAPATSATLTKSKLSLLKGKTEVLVLNIAPLRCNDTITYTSSNTGVATVSANGTVRAENLGTATITATAGNRSTSCTVTVLQPVTGMSLNKSSHTLQETERFQLTVTVRPDNAYDRTVTWSSSDPSVVAVSQNGLITALKAGTATVKAEANDGSGYNKTCKVTVTQFKTGWKSSNGKWTYYLNGSLVKNNWVFDGGKWYYCDGAGYMVCNRWMKDSKGWVYLGSSGAMLTNAWCKDSQGWCYVGADGYAVTNCWKKDSVGWIYLNASGSMTKNSWVFDGGKWYYCDSAGYMVCNRWMKDSKGWVYLGSSGAMLTNAWCKDSQGWCFVGADGYAVTNCWKKDSVGWIYLNASGSMTKNSWVFDGGKWYYCDSAGYMVCNRWMKIGGYEYYFYASGAMAANTRINGYWVDSNGRYIPGK